MIKTKKHLSDIKPYVVDLCYSDCELKLDSNENPYGPSPLVIEAIRSFDVKNIGNYPVYGELISKLAETHSVKNENIVLTNGCDEAINVLFEAFLDKHDKVLSFSPTFSMPKLYSKCLDAEFREIAYQDKWSFDIKLFCSKVSRDTKILYLTSPNNPTGDLISVEVIKELAKKYKDKIVAVDCTYLNYAEVDSSDYYELVHNYNNIAILRSFSKDYALAGLRIGYILADSHIISEVKKVISPYSVSSLAVRAALAALSDNDYFLHVKSQIIQSKRILYDGLQELGYKVYNSSANFILVDFGEKSEFVYKKFLNNGIQVKYFKNVSDLHNCLRITLPKKEDAPRLLELLKPRPLYVFDLDGVVFDVKNSYRLAIKKTFEHFTGKTCSDEDIQRIKNNGGMSNDWDVTYQLIMDASGIKVDYDLVVNIFQDFFFVPDRLEDKGLIDNEKNVFTNDFFERLSKIADCAVFTGRPSDEAFYSLAKFGLTKYFSYFVCNEDVLGNVKPSPFGLNKIKNCCIFSKISYFGDTVDDIQAGKDACVDSYGIIPPNAADVESTKKKLFEYGAKGVFESPEQVFSELIDKDLSCKQ